RPHRRDRDGRGGAREPAGRLRRLGLAVQPRLRAGHRPAHRRGAARDPHQRQETHDDGRRRRHGRRAAARPQGQEQGMTTGTGIGSATRKTLPAPPLDRVPWLAVGVFVATAMALAWLVAIPLWADVGVELPLTLVGIVMMFTPLLA